MATPTADKLKIYFPSRNLITDGQTLPIYTVVNGSLLSIADTALIQPNGYWNGAIGWFEGNTVTAELRGHFFHVQLFDGVVDTLLLSRELPATPVPGDNFRLVLGGKRRSSHETFGMLVGGQLPELSTIVGANITGLTIKKASALLGEDTLTVQYTSALQILRIKMGSQNFGVGLDVSMNVNGGIIFAADGQAFIQVDVVAANLPTSDATDTWTLAYPERTLTPDFESYETKGPNGGKTRYRLECVKNEDPIDCMVDLTVYAGKPPGAGSTIAAGPSLGLAAGYFNVTDASSWPTRSFWVRNKNANYSMGDCRYVNYRSGNTLYCYGVNWAILGFDRGTSFLQQNDAISGFTSGATAVVDQIQLMSGSWGNGDAVGILLLKRVTGDFVDNEQILVGSVQMAMTVGNPMLGLRGYMAVPWNIGDQVEVMADVDIGMDEPSSNQFQNPTGETIAPDNVYFLAADDIGSAISLGNLAPGEMQGVWRREWIMDEHQSRAGVIADTRYSWS